MLTNDEFILNKIDWEENENQPRNFFHIQATKDLVLLKATANKTAIKNQHIKKCSNIWWCIDNKMYVANNVRKKSNRK